MGSDPINLSLRAPLYAPLDVHGLTPDRLAALSQSDIARLPVWLGPRAAAVGDFFTVAGERSPRLRIEGPLQNVHGLGAGMTAGDLLVVGDAGRDVGARMTGGRIEVRGHVGDGAGVAMAGGVLRVTGNAGDRLGSAAPGASKGMTGGEIIVHGSAGADAAARARRGLVVVLGDVGETAGRAMIAGTLVVLGRAGRHPGRANKRGTIIGAGDIVVPPTYEYACTFAPPHVRLTMTHLHRRHGLTIAHRIRDGRYRRYCGDAGEPGKGEILVLEVEK